MLNYDLYVKEKLREGQVRRRVVMPGEERHCMRTAVARLGAVIRALGERLEALGEPDFSRS